MSDRVIEKILNIFRKNENEIEPNIERLPEKIGNHKVIIQYTPPKGLSPSEVGVLYYKDIKHSDLDAILYERAYQGKISIKSENNTKIITKLKEYNGSKPYEKHYRNLLFGSKEGSKQTMYFKSGTLFDDYKKIEVKILDYCKEKGRLTYELKKNRKPILLIPLGLGAKTNGFEAILIAFLFFLIISGNGGLVVMLGFIGLFVWIYNSVTVKNMGNIHIKSLHLTDEGEKLLAHIYGYKYYLEKCEEEQFKNLMEEDPTFLDKTLPYIIALRLNRYFLENQSILYREDMDITTISK